MRKFFIFIVLFMFSCKSSCGVKPDGVVVEPDAQECHEYENSSVAICVDMIDAFCKKVISCKPQEITYQECMMEGFDICMDYTGEVDNDVKKNIYEICIPSMKEKTCEQLEFLTDECKQVINF